jgi:hypothetical protein
MEDNNMRYFVYASNAVTMFNYNFNRIDAICDTVSIENAYEQFQKCVRELSYPNVWFIADFEKFPKSKKKLFKKPESIGVLSDESLNYFPIAEYHFDQENENKLVSAKDCIRKDLVHMTQNGIQFSYTNNLEAAEQMQYVIDNRIKSVFTLDSYTVKDLSYAGPEEVNIKRTILDTAEYLNRNKDMMNCISYICLDTSQLIPKEIDRMFINENLRTGDKFTNVNTAENTFKRTVVESVQ